MWVGGIFFFFFIGRNALSGTRGPLPSTAKTLAHLDSTRTPRQLVKRLGKHTDKHRQPHLKQLISKSIALPAGKPAQQMTFWTHAVMHTQRLTFQSLSPNMKPTLTIYITQTRGHVPAFPSLPYSTDPKTSGRRIHVPDQCGIQATLSQMFNSRLPTSR